MQDQWKPAETTYTGLRSGLGQPLVAVNLESSVDNRVLLPAASQKLRNHSPDGFEWGYAGSGPAQLALALLLDFTEDAELSCDLYMSFKFTVVAKLKPEWKLTGRQVASWLHRRRIENRYITKR